MATYSTTYGKYFSAVNMALTNNSSTINQWDGNGSWDNCIARANEVMSSLQRDNGYYRGAISFYNNYNATSYIYSGTIYMNVQFFNSKEGNIYTTVQAYLYFNSGNKTYTGLNNGTLLNALNEYSSNGCGFYISSISLSNVVFHFKGPSSTMDANFNYVFMDLRGPGSSNSLANTAYTTSYSLSKGGYLKDIYCSLAVTNRTVTYLTKNIIVRNERTIDQALSYRITPTFINDTLKNTAYNEGWCGSGSSNLQGNHQYWMTGTTKNGKLVLEDIKSGCTRHGSFSSPTSGINQEFIYTLILTDLTTASTTTHTFVTWQANNYRFFRNSGKTQEVTDPSYNTFNSNSYSTSSPLVLYVSGGTVTINIGETIILRLYDVDEGTCSLNNQTVYVPPTDVIMNTGSTLNNLYMKTRYTYNFSDTTNFDGFYVLTSSENKYVSQQNTTVPTGLNPEIARIVYTGHTQTLPADPNGFIFLKPKNKVTSNGVVYPTSVRYHLTGDVIWQRGSISSNRRTSYYYVGVKKNNINFVNGTLNDQTGQWEGGISSYNGTWSDTINGVSYSRPIAYANKISTISDLMDKLACYHGAAMEVMGGFEPNTLYNLRSVLTSSIWDNYIKYWYNQYVQIKRPGFRRYITYDGTTYYEDTWGIRWKNNYPTFTSYDDPTFYYMDTLVFKHPYDSNGNVFVALAGYITEAQWNALATGTTTYTVREDPTCLYFNGLYAYDEEKFMVTIGSTNVVDNWNYYRRGVADNEMGGTNTVSIYDWVREVIYTEWDQFDLKAEGNCSRYISGSYGSQKQATNANLYTVVG